MNLIILTDKDKISDNSYKLSDHRAEHIKTILKLQVGDRVEIGILNGASGQAEIIEINNLGLILDAIRLNDAQTRKPEIEIIMALPRPQILKRVFFISAMMNIRRIYLIKSNRVEKSYFQSPLMEPEKQLPFLIEGLSQGKNTRLPVLSIHNKFKIFVEDVLAELLEKKSAPSIRLLPDLESDEYLNSQKFNVPGKKVIAAIGPEGGWVPFEIDLFEKLGFETCRLSENNLRVDSALTALISQIELLTFPGIKK